MVMAGQVRVNGQVELKASTMVSPDVRLDLVGKPRFVSRGGDKLNAGLDVFPVNVTGRVCADVGSSTGGFTDCLLQRGAAKVFAIDVGKGLLDWKLRTDPRVILMEKTNARYVKLLSEPVSLVAIDASFISLKILLPVVKCWFAPILKPAFPSLSEQRNETSQKSGDIIALIKPQFEAGRRISARNKGVIRNQDVHRAVLKEIFNFAQQQGLSLQGLIRSPLVGPKGNIEFLAWLKMGEPGLNFQQKIDKLFELMVNGDY
jgi:23S rRNA (cytidine1920-2'-O)/16S rRNA (cytidine1409-2'-O)-methyltransferase